MTRFVAFALTLLLAAPAAAQVGKSLGVVDANTVSEADLAKLPGMTPAIAKALVAARPFDSITALNTFLLGQKLTPEQANALYRQMFVQINLNAASDAEILLIPGMGNRMLGEFKEYRPYKALAQFRREIGKYVDDKELARLEQYVFVPINLNTASDADILTIPGMGQRMLGEFKEYRPYKAIQQFRREIGKYVDDKEVARLERYVTLN